ncbi:SRPBCC family protein [Catenuloplanes atrovinosus]|uniref:Polyketide cyclase/dehydrase n=1 Tax=Catenuloplanes atrovinosus TaxID=137266 RepID=A0AAE3YHT9_9ACTN|nr:SRPBCC family protein [Catenuloplanes atrovinosus]MDR7274208.1 hypothetical protein [Catenuloplanes atrovinosus]
MSHYDVRARSAAGVATVFGLVTDVSSWPSWQRIDRVRPQGEEWVVGGSPTTVIRVVDVVPDRSLTYVETSGTLWHDYRSTIELTPADGGGTDIRWHATFRSRHALLSRFWPWYLRREMRGNADRLARRAESIHR